MRRFTFHLVIATLTFTIGLIGSYLARDLLLHSASVNVEFAIPAATAPADPVRICEVHGSVLKPVRVQRICGEYRGSYMGGWAATEVGCTSPQKRRMLLEDAQFYLNLSGGLNTLMWWKEAEDARKAKFPHGYGWTYQDCESGEERCATIYSCAECRATEVRWKRNSLRRSGR